ncbi:restriction endonuclease subunit M [Proteiniborus sp. MB09-C3]|uniref:restriction endonuclease subunit M n=1 Tax=Proteiniborus sp. MB09-C3 TaxID=3050072 RepID=UPI00255579CD|nr:restriction endonuclease subunit M [Proteiniborus sp. MB09-C3]WIV13604.1 restriction endonuclease subunit M [Proteiniborus sp. MB09-C3]
MKSNIIVDIIEEDVVSYGQSLLNILLKDRTTNQNIIWASNDYSKFGDLYKAECEIKPLLITNSNDKVIQPRITKTYKKQNIRTREKAEVFTPSWVCNEQNNLIDEQWFGRKDVFNIQKSKSWKPTNNKIPFTDEKGRTWKDYVDARRIEITCGEAPYLVSRYDTVTGETIELVSRIGLLDRKMRVINENLEDEDEWQKWTERAFQSVYGYEYQGDNLLLARENLLYTYIENMKYKFERSPSLIELKRIATIISWNIWQMDGITFSVPLCDMRCWFEQLTLFDNYGDINNEIEHKYCKIKDWRSRIIIEYRSLVGGGK